MESDPHRVIFYLLRKLGLFRGEIGKHPPSASLDSVDTL